LCCSRSPPPTPSLHGRIIERRKAPRRRRRPRRKPRSRLRRTAIPRTSPSIARLRASAKGAEKGLIGNDSSVRLSGPLAGGRDFPGVLLTDVWVTRHNPSKRRSRGLAITPPVEIRTGHKQRRMRVWNSRWSHGQSPIAGVLYPNAISEPQHAPCLATCIGADILRDGTD
jgi:hypothetical protein